MRNATQAIATAAASVMLAVSGGALLYQEVGPWAAGELCDVASLRSMAAEAEDRDDEARQRYIEGEIEVCLASAAPSEDGTQDGATTDADGDKNGTPGDTPGDADTKEPAPSGEAACQVTYLADQPVTEARWSNSYAGDDVALHPDFAGTAMSDLTVEQALREGEYRRSIDPMLTVADAMAYGVLPELSEDDQMVKTRQLAADCAEWSRIQREVTRVERDDYTHQVKTFAPGVYEAMYALSKDGDVPLIVRDSQVRRNESFTALVSTRKSDGRVVIRRLECGFQQYFEKPRKGAPTPELPQPSPGMDRDEEGMPTPKQPDKPKETPKPTPSQTPTPSDTPTPTPTPTDTPTPTPTPTDTPTSECPYGKDDKGNCKKSPNPDDYEYPEGKPPVGAPEGPPEAAPNPPQQDVPGGRPGDPVVDNPTNPPGSETGVGAPGADPPSNNPNPVPPPEDGANTPVDDDPAAPPEGGNTEPIQPPPSW